MFKQRPMVQIHMLAASNFVFDGHGTQSQDHVIQISCGRTMRKDNSKPV